jgi:ATP-grasp domain
VCYVPEESYTMSNEQATTVVIVNPSAVKDAASPLKDNERSSVVTAPTVNSYSVFEGKSYSSPMAPFQDTDSIVSILSDDGTGGGCVGVQHHVETEPPLPKTVYPTDKGLIMLPPVPPPVLPVEPYDLVTNYSDFVKLGLDWQRANGKSTFMVPADAPHAIAGDSDSVLMLYECPSSCCHETSFFNSEVYRFHDWPPSASQNKSVLAPCRYSMMNGATYPSYLMSGDAEPGLVQHWAKYIPDFVAPRFQSHIPDAVSVYAYLPVESIKHHVNDPYVHYHLAGKDAIPMMSPTRTTKILSNTKDHRPCIVKTTHSMASKGIFVIYNDDDEAEFQQFLQDSGNPTYIITDYIDIKRNVACHFYIHPAGQITWFGSNENVQLPDGKWSSDSTIIMSEQDELRDLQMPFVQDVAQYCLSLGFWGFCGIDVLFDTAGVGYVVDVNPRVTGSCPSIMVAQRLHATQGYEYCLFRRKSKFPFRGSRTELFDQVDAYNAQQAGRNMIVLASVCELEDPHTGLVKTLVNIGAYSTVSIQECQDILDTFTTPDDEIVLAE